MPTFANPKEITLNLRIDEELKSEFTAAAHAESRPASEVLRRLMREYVQRAKREAFFAEAKRQSLLLYSTPEGRAEEEEVMHWLDQARASLPEESDEEWFRAPAPAGDSH